MNYKRKVHITKLKDWCKHLGSNIMLTRTYPKLIKITGITFNMGDVYGLREEDEQPVHEVVLSDYYIGETAVTVAQYRAYCIATGTSMPEIPRWGLYDNDPIVNINWNDAINYCVWLSEKLDKNITLPTEAQWEFAAKGGNQSKGYEYSGGQDLTLVGWYSDNANVKAHRVAQKKANELGLYDMSGNVWEWCLDWYDENYYNKSPHRNPKCLEGSDYRVLRGGSWRVRAFSCRASFRVNDKPNNRSINYGFRVVSV